MYAVYIDNADAIVNVNGVEIVGNLSHSGVSETHKSYAIYKKITRFI